MIKFNLFTISMRFIFLLLSIFSIALCVKAQNVPIGHWNEHLSYRNGVCVAEGNGKVYCATTSGIFVLNKSDNSTQRLSKVNGLSDIEATVLNFNKNNNKLLIGYKNSNIDIISNSTIINIADIKNKSIIGNKSINNIYFINQYAYLCCGFGIVVLDMDKNEIKDTYYIGTGGNAINVRDITSDGTNIYAATDDGVYTALLSNPNLADYLSWTKFNVANGLPNGIYNTIASFNGKVYVNYSKFLMNGTLGNDSLFEMNSGGSTWMNFLPASGSLTYTTYSLRTFNNLLMIIYEGAVDTYNNSLALQDRLFTYLNDYVHAIQGVYDSDNHYWLADPRYGMVKCNDSYNSWNYYVDGPVTENVYNIMYFDNDIWIAPGSLDAASGNVYQREGISIYNGNSWQIIKGNYHGIVNMDTLFDLLYLAQDPLNPNKIFASTWWGGVLEIDGKVPTKLYNAVNTSAFHTFVDHTCKTSGLAFDSGNNLWVCNSLNSPSALVVRRPNNTWQAIDLSLVVGESPYLGQLLIDKNDQKWIVLSRGSGLAVYKGSSTPANSGNCKKLTTASGNGKLPSAAVYCLAEDADGQIWVGTDKGIGVFYSPENVFTGDNFDCQQILLTQDGHVQILLETEQVQSIAVDDANRKWIGTVSSGVFLMSADGTKQIQHFDMNNSPLFSNNVKSIGINHKTGEVYFGTDKGLISYRGTATEGSEDFTDVYAFPNPVKHEYTGPVAIKGLVNNTILKITDITGTLVYETKSEGGQAIWDAKNFAGERVSSGVYMVFCTNEDGSKKIVTKILVIN